MDRRQFNTLAAASLGSLITPKLWAERTKATASSDKFYFALIADTHIIDDFYVKGSENGVEDNESILVTTPRLVSARDLINSQPRHRAGLSDRRLLPQLPVYRLRLLLPQHDAAG